MMENEIYTDQEQPRTRRDVVRLGAALLGTSVGLAGLTGAAAREREPGDDHGSGGGGRDDRRRDDNRRRRRRRSRR
jgi:hypothetical protein